MFIIIIDRLSVTRTQTQCFLQVRRLRSPFRLSIDRSMIVVSSHFLSFSFLVSSRWSFALAWYSSHLSTHFA